MPISLKPPNVETYHKLSKRSRVSLEQKIEIFEKFMQTGKELVGNTTFEGYPIGQWAVQIRNRFNRINKGKDDRGKINLTKEQLEKLESMGILKRQFDSAIDEKIDSLVEWRKKYPKIKIVPMAIEIELRKYAKTEDEFRKIQEEYKRMQRYYDYVRYRKYQGKLNEEQMQKCKEGEVGGVFGYSTKIEELAKKYGIAEKDVDYLLTEYGTMDNAYEMYNKGETYSETLERIIKDAIDVNNNHNRGYDMLWCALGMPKEGEYFYSSEEMKKLIDKQLTEKWKIVLEKRFGLVDDTKPKKSKEIGVEIGVTRARIEEIEKSALRRLKRNPKRMSEVIKYSFKYSPEFITDKERAQIEKIKKDIRLQNGDLSENLKKLEEFERIIEKRMSTLNSSKIGLDQKLGDKIDELKVENLDFTIITFKCLKKAGINSLYDLTQMTRKEVMRISGLGPKRLDEIVAKMQKYGISFKQPEQKGKAIGLGQELGDKIDELKVENLDFTIRTVNCLERAGIYSLYDLTQMTRKEVMRIRGLGQKRLDEIVAKMQEYGISFKQPEQSEEERAVAEKSEIIRRIIWKQQELGALEKEISGSRGKGNSKDE